MNLSRIIHEDRMRSSRAPQPRVGGGVRGGGGVGVSGQTFAIKLKSPTREPSANVTATAGLGD